MIELMCVGVFGLALGLGLGWYLGNGSGFAEGQLAFYTLHKLCKDHDGLTYQIAAPEDIKGTYHMEPSAMEVLTNEPKPPSAMEH